MCNFSVIAIEAMNAGTKSAFIPFDIVNYWKMIYQQPGVSGAELLQPYDDNDRDEVKFVQSRLMQSLTATVQESWQPFEPIYYC